MHTYLDIELKKNKMFVYVETYAHAEEKKRQPDLYRKPTAQRIYFPLI